MSYCICTACAIPHYENCDTCFGFGVYAMASGELYPVTANEAIETKVYRGKLQPCPECGSTVAGVPETQTEREERDLMRDILKSAAGIYANMGTDTPLTYWFSNQDIPILRPSERIRVVLIREHDEPRPGEPMDKQAEYVGSSDDVVIDRFKGVYPVSIDVTSSVLYELFSLTIPPAETISINLEYRAMDLCTSDVSSDFTVDAMFSVDRGIVKITNNTEEDRTLENFKVYGRRIYMDAVKAYKVEGVAV